MSKEERAIYDRFIDNRRIALGQLMTVLMKGRSEGRKEGLKLQEDKIKQIEKELQEKTASFKKAQNSLKKKKIYYGKHKSILKMKREKLHNSY